MDKIMYRRYNKLKYVQKKLKYGYKKLKSG